MPQTIAEFEVVTPVTRDNQEYKIGTTIHLDITDAQELLKVGAIKLPESTPEGALPNSADTLTGANTSLVLDDEQPSLVNQVAVLQATVDAAQLTHDALLADKELLSGDLQAATTQLADTKKQLAEADQANQALQAQIAELQAQLAAGATSVADVKADADAPADATAAVGDQAAPTTGKKTAK